MPLQTPSFWDATALIADGGSAESSSTIPPSLSLPSLGQLSTASASLPFSPATSQPASCCPPSRTVLRIRAPRTREGHRGKRSRLDSGTTPYNSIDYRLQFDKDETILESLDDAPSQPDANVKRKPREGLFSTPLSWEKPQMELRIDSSIGPQSSTLSEAQQRRLIAIAMNRQDLLRLDLIRPHKHVPI